MKRWLSGLLAAFLLLSLAACSTDAGLPQAPPEDAPLEEAQPPETGDTGSSEDAGFPEDTGAPEDPGGDTLPDGLTGAVAPPDTPEAVEPLLAEDGSYTTKEDVALYLYLYGHLPDNFITKREAQELGWSGGSLEPYAPGMCIGGTRFGNYEGLLPEAEGRTYTECDIDTLGAKSRGAKRIVFSNDGLIYYTEDHYESFQLLYGDEGYD